MDGYEPILLGGTIVLQVCALLLLSLPFDTPYERELRFLARQPFFRFAAFFLVLVAMDWNPIVGALSFLIVVFWFYDVSVLSTVALQQKP